MRVDGPRAPAGLAMASQAAGSVGSGTKTEEDEFDGTRETTRVRGWDKSWLHNAPGVVASRCCARGVPACDTAIHDAQLCIHSAWLHQPRPGPHRQRMCHRVVAQVCRAIGSLTCLSTRPFELEIGCPYLECQQTFGAWYLAVADVAVPQPGFRF